MNKIALLITCEHAVDTIPAQYSNLFVPFRELLASHRGIDFGALSIALYLQEHLPCDFVQAQTSRLLIDCNRSLKHPSCFSEATNGLSVEKKQLIINHYYLPYREQVINLIKKHVAAGLQVWHLSIHSFTPIMDGITRNADIGLLYDPQRSSEKKLASKMQKEIKALAPNLRVRMNYPYKGTSDGFTSALRKQFTDASYTGIEVESNQALTKQDHSLNNLKNLFADSVLKIIC